MAGLPEIVQRGFKGREGPVGLATVDPSGIPNAIYASCVSLFDSNTLVIADNYLSKTRSNIEAGSKGSVLFITKEGKSYQVKGRVEYHRDGEVFEDMKRWNPPQLPGHAAVALKVEEVYTGAERLV